MLFPFFEYCDHLRWCYDEIPHGIVLHITRNKISIILAFLHDDFIKNNVILINEDFVS